MTTIDKLKARLVDDGNGISHDEMKAIAEEAVDLLSDPLELIQDLYYNYLTTETRHTFLNELRMGRSKARITADGVAFHGG